jgi:hypothetical protein
VAYETSGYERASPISSASVAQMSKIKQKKQKKQAPITEKYKKSVNDLWIYMIYFFFEDKYPNANVCWDDMSRYHLFYHGRQITNPFRVIWKLLTKCKTRNKRFIFFSLTLNPMRDVGHRNILMFDLKKKLLFRFEPHKEKGVSGYKSLNDKLNADIIKNILKNPKNLDYVTKYETSNMSPQYFENYDIDNQYFIEIDGLCIVYSLWFVELMIKNPKINPNQIVKYISQKVDRHRIRTSTKIRLYLDRMLDIYDEMMNQ